MRPLLCLAWCLTVGGSLLYGEQPDATNVRSVQHGRELLLHDPLNPAQWSMAAYDNAWKQWGLKTKPADYDRAFRERYGLHMAPFDNHGLPMGLIESRGFFFTTGFVHNCLLCHAGRVAGQTIMGLGNSTVDVQGIFDELLAADHEPFKIPFQLSSVRGTVDPVSSVALLLAIRDPELNLRRPMHLDYYQHVCSDPPAWWLLKKKKTRDWTGGIDARSTRIDLANLLTPLNSAATIKGRSRDFVDLHAYIFTLEPPHYPFPIDRKLAERGKDLFVKNCARCHGTYGEHWTYPNKIVPLNTIGTDPLLSEALTGHNIDYVNKTWLAREPGPDGKPIRVYLHHGYQAPPLDGIWATAPYFHNGSVPTVYEVLNSKARPRIYTRSYGCEKEDYDPVKLGLKITVLDAPPDPKLSRWEQRRIYDTTQPGRHNTGHTFGDHFTDTERMAVIEYLKTL
ncbi:MAG TPA: hypothetical protein VFA18_12765 [Gemmataceae bacterium]|nr:hypothetical protein [Gemmataceae bacterium]